MDPDALRADNKSLARQLDELKDRITDQRQSNARHKRPTEDGLSELKRVDRALARARRENGEMREQLESHAGELDHAQRLKNAVTDLRARLDSQLEENDLLEKLTARQTEQLGQMGLSAAQKRELERLRGQKEEMQEQLRACSVRANELTRSQHSVQLQWAKLLARREKLKRGLSGDAAAASEAAFSEAAFSSAAIAAALGSGRFRYATAGGAEVSS